ncbi:uncharacterized protein LOC127858419 [Dreissena polymorpha]|uniref:Uncharacterized protein n=1 Tax=Dreissena polymorpha TaxID=45954 RepID=A0A9D4S5X9_DREPO|nr:uncharacterized protein LOC127858419 [Dreissena polymorpha]XP_052251535.1 uncharacterized protein LOC127858419 [Dreissena polymorpha]XP_052251544.1 uncharacterized protein LOC127858419 [Dreissena polymorpha]KAH3892801.1 hypothetical protein DPMN_016931 [Dreissena polymorpha]
MGSSFSLEKSMKPIQRPNAHSHHTPFRVAPGTVNTGNVQMPCTCNPGTSYQQPLPAQVMQPPPYMTQSVAVAGNGFPVPLQQTHGFVMQHPGYGMRQPVFVMQQPEYRLQQPSFGVQQPFYGKQQHTYDMHQPGPATNLGYSGARTMDPPPPYTENSEPMVGAKQNEAVVYRVPVTEVSPNVETDKEEISSVFSPAHETNPAVNQNNEQFQITEHGAGDASNQEELLLV